MGEDPDYTKYGPYALCAALQDEHGKLIADSDWPTLALKLPETNNVLPEESLDTNQQIQCYRCKQYGHKANNPICPMYSKKPAGTSDQSNAGSDKRHQQKDPWKYIKPKDLQQLVIINDKKWFFCQKCKCRATGKIGFYQLSHTDDIHDPNWRPESNATPIEDPDATSLPPLCPPNADEIVIDDDLVFTGVN